MRKSRKSALALSLTAALVLTIFISALSASAAYGFTERSAKKYDVVEGVTYSEYDITSGENGNTEVAAALQFSKNDFIPMVFSCFAGTSGVLQTQYNYAVNKYGYEVVGIINGSFCSMDSEGYGAYGTLVGINISDGKITSAHAGYQGEVVAFMSDGSLQVVNSALSYTLVIDGKEVPNGLYYINKTSGTAEKGASQWKNQFYYYDTSCGRICDTSEFVKGYEVLCKKVENTELVVGGTLRGEVISVTPNTSKGALAENYYDMSDKFILFVKNDSPLTSYVTGLAAGDKVEITTTETVASSKEVMEKASSVITNVGWLVKDGVDQTQIQSTIGSHSVTLGARWTAFGVKEDGSYIFFTTEGGSTGQAGRSVTLRDVAKALKDMGCKHVFRLDGGGSTAMYVSDDGTGNPGYKTPSSRSIGDCILIVRRPQASDTAKTALDNLISLAEGELEKAEDASIRAALNAGNAVKEAATSTSGDYTRAIMKLSQALSGDAELAAALDLAKTVKFFDFSESELVAIWEAYKKASEVRNNENATNSEIKEAAAELMAALNISANVALGKSYTLRGLFPNAASASWPDEGGITLTDGKDATTATYGDAAWVGFNISADDIKNDNPKLSSITVDLAGNFSLNKFVLRIYDGHGDVGISAPSGVVFYYSANGTDWTKAGDGALEKETAEKSLNAFVLEVETPVSAKYVKAEITHSTNWAFVSEFEAYKASEKVPAGCWVSTFNQQITTGMSVIFTGDETTDLTYADANVRWSRAIYLRWDEAKGGYKVYKIKAPDGNDGGVIEAGDVVLGVHNAEAVGDPDGSTANSQYASTAKVGDYVEFHGISISGKNILPGGYFAFKSANDFDSKYSGVEGETEPDPDPIQPDYSTLWDEFDEDDFFEVNSATGIFQNNKGINTRFWFQSANDDNYIYFAVVSAGAPVGTAEEYGNGKGTTIRVWFRTNNEATLYTHFIDIAYDGDGSPYILAKKNGSLTENKDAVEIATTGLVVENVVGENYWLVQFKLPYDVIEAEDDFGYYIQVWDAEAADCLLYPVTCPEDLDDTVNTNYFPYKGWTDQALAVEIPEPGDTSEETSEESFEESSEEESAEPSEVSETSGSIPTGDTGFVAVGLLAVIALAGIVVVKKRK